MDNYFSDRGTVVMKRFATDRRPRTVTIIPAVCSSSGSVDAACRAPVITTIAPNQSVFDLRYFMFLHTSH